VTLKDATKAVLLPGFMFDMNRFFQHLLSRFLHEHLVGFDVRDEHTLRHVLAYASAWNPKRRAAPAPRPDFAIQRAGRTEALLDAKYRDLWETQLPREMLYQLALYAVSQPGDRSVAILYPTANASATEQRIDIRDPMTARRRATVCLRPVRIDVMEDLLASPSTAETRAQCSRMAMQLAFGASPAASSILAREMRRQS
jgi:5-methylcytosine-specific restriction enzyme subunit McrC